MVAQLAANAAARRTDAGYFGNGLGIAVRKGNSDLLNEFNTALAALKADGSWQQINQKWFPE
ncbi:hypothetical protein CRX72_13140 [Pantoea sp. BRM17]|nr:hypothetical protein CRX72_13140 [Pantoea sp. BRM17]